MSNMEGLWNDSGNSFTVPWKFALIVAGIRNSRIPSLTPFAASPSEKPGRKLKEIVTAGSWPKWLTLNGPTERFMLTPASRGTSDPLDDRMYNLERASG